MMMNIELLKYVRKSFGLQRVAEVYNLKTTQEFRDFLIGVVDTCILDTRAKEIKDILEKGDKTLTADDGGYCTFKSSFYDVIVWDNTAVFLCPEHGTHQKIISNLEILTLKDFLKLGDESSDTE